MYKYRPEDKVYDFVKSRKITIKYTYVSSLNFNCYGYTVEGNSENIKGSTAEDLEANTILICEKKSSV